MSALNANRGSKLCCVALVLRVMVLQGLSFISITLFKTSVISRQASSRTASRSCTVEQGHTGFTCCNKLQKRINQSINQSTNQPTNQPTNLSPNLSEILHFVGTVLFPMRKTAYTYIFFSVMVSG